MKKPHSLRAITAGLLGMGLSFLSVSNSYSATNCPVLMILERSTNTNRVWYENGDENSGAPIVAKWEMREKGPDQWEPLTGVEQRRAYGIKPRSNPEDSEFKFSLAGMQSFTLTLKKDNKTECPYISYSQKDGPEMNVQRVFLTIEKGIIPSASKIEFFGLSMNDDREIQTEIKL